MNTDTYLSQLENEPELLDEPISTPPPENSSFYWINNDGIKYKAFLPTPNRLTYTKLQEYDYADIEPENYYDNWHKAKKVVQFAYSENAEDKPVIGAVHTLISKLRTQDHFYDPSETSEYNKYYVLQVYRVNDVIDVPMEDRFTRAIINERISVSPYNHELIDAHNAVFKEIAKYFCDNEEHQVLCYGNIRSNY